LAFPVFLRAGNHSFGGPAYLDTSPS